MIRSSMLVDFRFLVVLRRKTLGAECFLDIFLDPDQRFGYYPVHFTGHAATLGTRHRLCAADNPAHWAGHGHNSVATSLPTAAHFCRNHCGRNRCRDLAGLDIILYHADHAIPTGVSAVATLVFLFPVGIALGIPFPTAVKALEHRNPTFIACAWA